MKQEFNDVLDAKKLMQFYGNQGFCISYRQLREWVRAGILHPQGWGSKRKLFPPTEVVWAGTTFLLRAAGAKLDFIKKMRLAVDSKPSGKKSKSDEVMKLASLLGNQRETIQSLLKSLELPRHQEIRVRDSDGMIRVLDEVSLKNNKMVVAEYKNSKRARPEEKLQMEYQKRYVESKLKGTKVKCDLRRFREKRGLSQIELATVLGFSQARLSQIENGWREPDDVEKNTMAGVLKEKVSVLFPN